MSPTGTGKDRYEYQQFYIEKSLCKVLKVEILQGLTITRGKIKDWLYKPDPYVRVRVVGTPNPVQETKHIPNTATPRWNEIFKFFIDRDRDRFIEFVLIDKNLTVNEQIGKEILDLDTVPHLDSPHILTFKNGSKIEVKLSLEENEEIDMRFSTDLCRQELQFLSYRDKSVAAAVQTIVQDRSAERTRLQNTGRENDGTSSFQTSTDYESAKMNNLPTMSSSINCPLNHSKERAAFGLDGGIPEDNVPPLSTPEPSLSNTPSSHHDSIQSSCRSTPRRNPRLSYGGRSISEEATGGSNAENGGRLHSSKSAHILTDVMEEKLETVEKPFCGRACESRLLLKLISLQRSRLDSSLEETDESLAEVSLAGQQAQTGLETPNQQAQTGLGMLNQQNQESLGTSNQQAQTDLEDETLFQQTQTSLEAGTSNLQAQTGLDVGALNRKNQLGLESGILGQQATPGLEQSPPSGLEAGTHSQGLEREISSQTLKVGEEHVPKQLPRLAMITSGGGFRAMIAYSGAYKALHDNGILDCLHYTGALSGSSWYLSTLYSHPKFPSTEATHQIIGELRNCVEKYWQVHLSPPWSSRYLRKIMKKSKMGQPVAFTDFFGYLVGEQLLLGRMKSKLSEQSEHLNHGKVPIPLYTCLHVKKNISAKVFQEWYEFSPLEVSIPKYGISIPMEKFGSKFFMGNAVSKYKEVPLHYLYGIWGSAFTILFKRLLYEKGRKGEVELELEEAELDGRSAQQFGAATNGSALPVNVSEREGSIVEAQSSAEVKRRLRGVVGVTLEDLLFFNEEYEEDFRMGIDEDFVDVLSLDSDTDDGGETTDRGLEDEASSRDTLSSPEYNVDCPRFFNFDSTASAVLPVLSTHQSSQPSPLSIDSIDVQTCLSNRLLPSTRPLSAPSPTSTGSPLRPPTTSSGRPRLSFSAENIEDSLLEPAGGGEDPRPPGYTADLPFILNLGAKERCDKPPSPTSPLHRSKSLRLRFENFRENLRGRRENLVRSPRDDTEQSEGESFRLTSILEKALSSNSLNSRAGRAGLIHNPLRGLTIGQNFPGYPLSPCKPGHLQGEADFKGYREPAKTDEKKIYLVDSGLSFNLPFPILLRPERNVKFYLVLDFSSRSSDSTQPFRELLLSEKWARLHKLPFPRIKSKVREFMQKPLEECYVFKEAEDPECPTIVFFPLINKDFRKYSAPGILRQTDDEKEFGNFDIFDNTNDYAIWRFVYPNLSFDRLTKMMEFNILNNLDTIKKEIGEFHSRYTRL